MIKNTFKPEQMINKLNDKCLKNTSMVETEVVLFLELPDVLSSKERGFGKK